MHGDDATFWNLRFPFLERETLELVASFQTPILIHVNLVPQLFRLPATLSGQLNSMSAWFTRPKTSNTYSRTQIGLFRLWMPISITSFRVPTMAEDASMTFEERQSAIFILGPWVCIMLLSQLEHC